MVLPGPFNAPVMHANELNYQESGATNSIRRHSNETSNILFAWSGKAPLRTTRQLDITTDEKSQKHWALHAVFVKIIMSKIGNAFCMIL